MRNLNNKGFAISTILYSLLVMATLILFLLIGNLSFERRSTDDFVSDIEDELNALVGGGEPVELNSLAETLLADESNNINKSDSEQTFITGENPNNYIWYSGKLWRAVSIDPTDNSVKAVTQWNISSIPFSKGERPYSNSYAEMWLNDESVDGFLGNLREPEKFIKDNSLWNATITTGTSKPAKTTMVENPVGLLNSYEYTMSYTGASSSTGYLNNGLWWFLITQYNTSLIRGVDKSGSIANDVNGNSAGLRPAINFEPTMKVAAGSGTENDPYRLAGDNDISLNGMALNTRYSGEYVRFGTGDNNLYRIVSHEESGLTKITSDEPLKENGKFKVLAFGNNTTFSASNTIGQFLNTDYLNINNGYLTNDQISMIVDSNTWYFGSVKDGENYRLAKYTDYTMENLTANRTTAKVGLLRLGELMAGQFSNSTGSKDYFTLTPHNQYLKYIYIDSDANEILPTSASGIKPTFNLKESVIISSGTGTKDDPFILENNL